MCLCCKAKQSSTHIVGGGSVVGESEMREEERDVWEEMMQMDEYDMEQFSTLDNSEKTIAITGDRWWPQKAKREGDEVFCFLCNIFSTT